jgi:SNF2 family DNA or RNA helicase
MPFKLPPLSYQQEVFDKIKNLKAAALFLEQGLGKSKISIDSMCHFAEGGIIKAVFVFAPTQIASNWALEEIGKHAWNSFQHDVFRWVKSQPRTVTLFKSALEKLPGEGRIWWFTLNKEALLDVDLCTSLRKFMLGVPSAVILDESTFIKNPTGKTSKSAINLGGYAKVRQCLSGTPQVNSPLDLFKQYQFLHTGILGCTTKKNFLETYCQTETKMFRVNGKLHQEEFAVSVNDLFYSRVAPVTFRYKKEEVLKDLPPKMYTQFMVELTPKHRKLYNLLRDNMIADLTTIGRDNGGEIRTFNKLATIIRLHQLLSGIAVTSEGTEIFESDKLSALKEILDTTTNSTIVWANFRYSIERITKHLKDKGASVGHLYGGMSAEDRDTTQKQFANGDLQFLIAHPKTAGKGLTFTKCSNMIFYENGYGYEDRVQSEDRIHRIGQVADSCQYIDMLCKDSIDEVIYDTLQRKLQLNDVLRREDLDVWLR